MVDERVDLFALVRMDDLSDRLVEQHDVIVLVDDAELRRRDGEINVFLARRFKKLVVDIALKQIAFAELLLARGARTVALDALETDVFLRQRRRKQGNGLAQKAVEPLTCIIFADAKFAHTTVSFPKYSHCTIPFLKCK